MDPNIEQINFDLLHQSEEYTSDRKYLDAMTEHYGLHLERTFIALSVVGHDRFEEYSPGEWDEFLVEYGRMISIVRFEERLSSGVRN